MQTIRVDLPFGALRQFDGAKDIRRLCLAISIQRVIDFWIRLPQRLEIHPTARTMANAGHEYDTRSVVRRAGGKDLWGEQFREEKWPDVARCDLAFEIIYSEPEFTNRRSSILNHDLTSVSECSQRQ